MKKIFFSLPLETDNLKGLVIELNDLIFNFNIVFLSVLTNDPRVSHFDTILGGYALEGGKVYPLLFLFLLLLVL